MDGIVVMAMEAMEPQWQTARVQPWVVRCCFGSKGARERGCLCLCLRAAATEAGRAGLEAVLSGMQVLAQSKGDGFVKWRDNGEGRRESDKCGQKVDMGKSAFAC